MIYLTLELHSLFHIAPCPPPPQLLAFSFELQAKFANGGETASTGTKKLRLHTELLSARKNDGTLNIIADDYEYALAA